ncbi:MAG: glycogen debranching enzyme N-terminal domain-containing protein, partial [Lachnospiraceae bacterium]|nr:glycogen debranching enzyme N-terminal domain-containing protein [Lachnospiraceae bacterium]
MRFLYGRNDFATLERGQENCYLLTNGLGGFSSMTMIGSCSRNDHALLMSCEKEEAPNHRYNMVHHLTEELTADSRTVFLSSQEYSNKKENEDGYRYQTAFSYEIYPAWSYLMSGVTVEKKVVMAQEKNVIAVSYRIINRSNREAVLKVTPGLQFVPKGHFLSKDQTFEVSDMEETKESVQPRKESAELKI